MKIQITRKEETLTMNPSFFSKKKQISLQQQNQKISQQIELRLMLIKRKTTSPKKRSMLKKTVSHKISQRKIQISNRSVGVITLPQ